MLFQLHVSGFDRVHANSKSDTSFVQSEQSVRWLEIIVTARAYQKLNILKCNFREKKMVSLRFVANR